jgi:nucleotide-binding universal stress UspA family protein
VHILPAELHPEVPMDPLPSSTDRDLSTAKLSLRKLISGEPFRHLHHEEILERGRVTDAVLNVIAQKKIDLLVVGSHKATGLKRLVLGSVSEQLFRCASCPVLMVGPSVKRPKQVRRILFATDFGDSSMQALPYAIDFADKSGGQLIMLHLLPPPHVEYVGPYFSGGTEELERRQASTMQSQLRELLPSNSGVKCSLKCVVEVNEPAEGIIDFAIRRDVDLIVMGVKRSSSTDARRASHMPWTIAHEVVCSAPCPVLRVRA